MRALAQRRSARAPCVLPHRLPGDRRV